METLGYVCEEISHQDLGQDEVNNVLTAVVQGMNLAENSLEILLAATRALCAFECLTSIALRYNEVLEPFMQDLFELMSNAVKGDEEDVAFQEIEFWSFCCDKEIELREFDSGDSGNIVPHSRFVAKALTYLLLIMLETLLK
ncbi:hypothetical protein GBA52_023821 [Prunus armeniaca]|nr:hypothetical protein GBA52_023821 [Prunus armeniaca]